MIAQDDGTAARSKNADSRGTLSRAAIAATRDARAARGTSTSAPSSARLSFASNVQPIAPSAVACAAPRLQMADEPEEKVVREEIRAGHERENPDAEQQHPSTISHRRDGAGLGERPPEAWPCAESRP